MPLVAIGVAVAIFLSRPNRIDFLDHRIAGRFKIRIDGWQSARCDNYCVVVPQPLKPLGDLKRGVVRQTRGQSRKLATQRAAVSDGVKEQIAVEPNQEPFFYHFVFLAYP